MIITIHIVTSYNARLVYIDYNYSLMAIGNVTYHPTGKRWGFDRV